MEIKFHHLGSSIKFTDDLCGFPKVFCISFDCRTGFSVKAKCVDKKSGQGELHTMLISQRMMTIETLKTCTIMVLVSNQSEFI